MRVSLSKVLRPGPAYTVEEISRGTGLKRASTWKLLDRKVRSGEILRIRRNLYVLPEDFEKFERPDFFRLANLIQTPSYISYLSALAYHEISTQIPASVIESANPVRTRLYTVKDMDFRYFYCRPKFYFGYFKEKGFFMAEPEKAFLDALYLISLGRYAWDESALDLKRLHPKTLKKYLKKYPPRFQKFYFSWSKSNEGA